MTDEVFIEVEDGIIYAVDDDGVVHGQISEGDPGLEAWAAENRHSAHEQSVYWTSRQRAFDSILMARQQSPKAAYGGLVISKVGGTYPVFDGPGFAQHGDLFEDHEWTVEDLQTFSRYVTRVDLEGMRAGGLDWLADIVKQHISDVPKRAHIRSSVVGRVGPSLKTYLRRNE